MDIKENIMNEKSQRQLNAERRRDDYLSIVGDIITPELAKKIKELENDNQDMRDRLGRFLLKVEEAELKLREAHGELDKYRPGFIMNQKRSE